MKVYGSIILPAILFGCGTLSLTLTFKFPGWCLNFSTWFMKTVLFEHKK